MWSAPVTVTPPATEPVTLTAVKEFLSIELDETLHDEQLTRFIAAARAQVEAVTGTRLVEQTVRVGASDWADLVNLPIGPVTAIAQIQWQDVAGVVQTLEPDIYELGRAGLQRAIWLQAGKYFPAGLRKRDDAIIVTLEVGYPEVPEPIQTAMLIMIADIFAQRESFAVGTAAAKVPSSMQVDNLLMNYRIWL